MYFSVITSKMINAYNLNAYHPKYLLGISDKTQSMRNKFPLVERYMF